jgi:small subunit ribosomal protein S17
MIMADTETNRALRKERTGIVVSSAMQKTIVVRVERTTRHPLYGKEMTQAKKYHAHDEENTAKVGDKVRIVETRPLSKLKRWRLLEIVEAAKRQ